MSSFTFADNKLGGRLTAICDAIGAGKLRTAAGILIEIGNELNAEAESSDGLLADDVLVLDQPVEPAPVMTQPSPATASDLQSCARGAHNYGPVDANGWRTCQSCQVVNVAPPDGGAIDMSNRALGDL